jgi:hypothetical protein
MEINHASIGGLQVHYWFAGGNDCLVITTASTTDGGMSLSWMLGWKPEDGFRAERLREDSRCGIGTRHEATLTDFPLAAAIAEIEKYGQGIERVALRRILELLHQAQAIAAATPVRGNP